MVPLHGLVKEHSRALVMVIGDCMQAVVGWELHGLCALEACMEVVNPRYIGPGGQVESRCIGSSWPSRVYMHQLSWPSGVF